MTKKIELKKDNLFEEVLSLVYPMSFICDKESLKVLWTSKDLYKKITLPDKKNIYLEDLLSKKYLEIINREDEGEITAKEKIYFLKTKKLILFYIKEKKDYCLNYSNLYDFANDIIQSVDSYGNLVYVNKEWENVLGYTSEEAKKMNFSKIIKKEHLEKCMKYFNELKKGKSLKGIRTCFISKDGKEIEVEGNISPIIINGKFIETIGIYRDIRKILEEENKAIKSKNFLEAIIENIPMCVLVKETKSLRFLFANKFAQDLIGRKSFELIGKDYDFFLDKKISKKFEEEDLKCIKNKKISSLEEELFINNEKKSLIIKRVPVFTKYDNNPDYLIIICEDITNLKEYEKEKEEYSNLWKDTFNTIDDMITIHDSEFNIILANKSFYENLNMNEKEVIGKKCFNLIHKKDFPIGDCPLMSSINKLIKIKKEIYEPNLKKYLEVSVSPIVKNGEAKNFVHIIRDITFRKNYEEEILKKNEELERINSFMINRELKMIELKKEVNSLLKELGREKKYKIDES